MIRADIISVVGREYLTSNIENDEYSYPKAFSVASLQFVPITNANGRKFEKLDIRFVKDGITVLVETKQNYPFEISPPSERRYRVLLKPRKSLKIRQFIHVKAL